MNPRHLSLLAESPIFERFSSEDLDVVKRRLLVLEFEPGDLLFRQGAPGRFVCFLMRGELSVEKAAPDGSSVSIARLGPGTSVGEMSVIDGLTCSATVTATERSLLLALTKEDFEELLAEHPRIGAEMFRGISRLLSMSLRRTSEDLAALKVP